MRLSRSAIAILIKVIATTPILISLLACASIPELFPQSVAPTGIPPDMSAPTPLSEPLLNGSKRCPVTTPNGSTPPSDWRASEESHGNGVLWVVFNPVLIATPPYLRADGSVGMKYGWYRGVQGKLVIDGQRIDQSAPPLRADIPEGYGDIGFQSTVIHFPTEGCWEVVGRVGDASLRFVTLVTKDAFGYGSANWLPDGLVHKNVDITDLPRSIRLHYGLSGERDGELVFETRNGIEKTTNTSPSGAQQALQVNGQSGSCAQGTFDAQQKWQSDADATMLEWSDSSMSYRITQTGLGLTCGDLVRVATPS